VAAQSLPRSHYTAPVSSHEPVAEFLERARVEAERYGLDPWVFLRELLQNARDAGAGRVWITVEREGGSDRIRCRDDGEGMTLDHARRYLFTLYASSKRDGVSAVGRFGVGFWAILRFLPDAITVRSRPRDGDGWEVCLDGSLSMASSSACVMLPGTEVVLERSAGAIDLESEVYRAVRDDARYLRRRDDTEQPLEVTVNGRPTGEPIELPAPSISFRRRGVRGAVALAAEPKVEVFAHGLRVRTTALLDELLLSGEESDSSSAPLPDGLVPRVVVDSDRLRVLLARGDAVEDRALHNAVAVARSELRRLVNTVLDRSAPVSWPGRFLERVPDLWRRSWVARLGMAVVVGGLLGITLALALGPSVWPRGGTDSVLPPPAAEVAFAEPAAPPVARSYRDLEERYRPAGEDVLFGALRISGIEPDGRPLDPVIPRNPDPYRGQPCVVDCLEVEIDVSAPAGPLRLPFPTGHLIDPDSVVFDGERMTLSESAAGEPIVLLQEPGTGRLAYRCGAGPPPRQPEIGSWPSLSGPLRSAALSLNRTPGGNRVAEATDLVRSLITYDRSASVIDRHRLARRRGAALFDRALAIGAGDCDVQNAVLAALLDESGVPARLAVGFVGEGGRTLPGLHAWVEYFEDNRWRIADASVGAGPPSRVTITSLDQVENVQPPASAVVRELAPDGSRPRLAVWAVALMAGAALLAVLGGVLLLRFFRSRRIVHRDADADLASLLRGVLLRPEAFGDVAAVHARRLVPRYGGRAISISRALRLARCGRLYRSDRGTALAHQASGRGVTVLDSAREEGRVVADLLGARDLDGWDGVLDRAETTPVTEHLEEVMRRAGEHWRVRVVSGAPDTVAFLEGRPLGFKRGSGVVVVDDASRLWRTVAGANAQPAWAAFVLGDAVTRVIDLEPSRCARLMAVLARRAVTEGVV